VRAHKVTQTAARKGAATAGFTGTGLEPVACKERPLWTGVRSPHPPGAARPAGRGPAGVCREPGGPRAGGGRPRGSRAVRRLRYGGAAAPAGGGAGRRDPHPAVLKCVHARPATLYVYVLLRFYITTVAISRGRTLSWRSIDLLSTCARADGSPRGSAAATSGSRDNPVPAATGRTLHRARPPSPFPPAPPPPHVCACAVLREPQP
jgi:hypothetical protein